MYDRNFKPQFSADITMPAKLFAAQILASYHQFLQPRFNQIPLIAANSGHLLVTVLGTIIGKQNSRIIHFHQKRVGIR